MITKVKPYQPTLAPSLPKLSVALNLFWFPRCQAKTIITSHNMSPSFTKEELRTRIHFSYHPWSRNFRIKILILPFAAGPSYRDPHGVEERNWDKRDSQYKIVCAQMCFDRIVSKIKKKKVDWYLWWLLEFDNENNPRTESRQSIKYYVRTETFW